MPVSREISRIVSLWRINPRIILTENQIINQVNIFLVRRTSLSTTCEFIDCAGVS